jgi:hypothetical protein
MADIVTRLSDEVAKIGWFDRQVLLPQLRVPAATVESLRESVIAIKQVLDAREGVSSSVLDKSLTMRDLIDSGAIQISVAGQTLGAADSSNITFPGTSGSSPPPPPPAPAPPPGLPTLSTPPTPSNLTANGAFHAVILSWQMLAYANHSHVEVHRATTNSLGSAVQIGVAMGNLYADQSVTVGVTYYYWVRAIGIDTDGVTTLTGPFNAVSGTAGGALLVNGTDLAPLSVTAEQLSQGTYPNINLVPNPGAEDGVVAWTRTEFSGVSSALTADTVNKSGGSQSFHIACGSDGTLASYGCRAFPVIPGETYSVKYKARANNTAPTLFVTFNEGATKPTTGYYGAAGNAGTTDRASFTTVISSAALTTSFASYETTYTVPAGVYYATLQFTKASGGSGQTDIWFDDVSVGRQITASFLAAGSIAAGSAVIQNGAIVDAMIDRATANKLQVVTADIVDLNVTNGKILDLDAAKITTGFLNAGRIQAGSIDATKIDSRNLTIKDGAGNVIFSSGVLLDYSRIQPFSGWLNSNILMNSNGTLSGAGSGQVTLGGLGAGAFATLSQINSGNIGTYIAGAAIDDAYIVNVNADKINAGSIRGINVNASSHTTKGSFFTSTVSAGAGTVNLHNTADFPSAGTAVVYEQGVNDYNTFTYVSKTATTLNGCSGVQSHAAGTTVVPAGSKSVTVDASTNELRMWDDRGDGTFSRVAQIGLSFADSALAVFGPASSSLAAIFASTVGTGAAISARSTGIGGNAITAVTNNGATAIVGSASAGGGHGVFGFSGTTSGRGVLGQNNAASGFAVRGEATGSSGVGVYGSSTSGYGGEFVGNGTRAPLKLTASSAPSNVSLGSCYVDGAGNFYVANGSTWRLIGPPASSPEPPPSTCFPAGALVLMADMSWKRIETIEAGDMLWGPSGAVAVVQMDTPLLGSRRLLGFSDGHAWSEEHAHWTLADGKQWWWSANPSMWRSEVAQGAIGGLRDNDSMRGGDDVEFAHIDGWKFNQIRILPSYVSMQLYLPLTEGSPIVVNGYLVGAGVNEFGYDYTKLDWDAARPDVTNPMFPTPTKAPAPPTT